MCGYLSYQNYNSKISVTNVEMKLRASLMPLAISAGPSTRSATGKPSTESLERPCKERLACKYMTTATPCPAASNMSSLSPWATFSGVSSSIGRHWPQFSRVLWRNPSVWIKGVFYSSALMGKSHRESKDHGLLRIELMYCASTRRG